MFVPYPLKGQAGQNPACPSCWINYPIHRLILIMIINNTAYIKQSSCLKVIQTFHEFSRFLRIGKISAVVIIEPASYIKRILYRFLKVIKRSPFLYIVCSYKRAFFFYLLDPFLLPDFHTSVVTDCIFINEREHTFRQYIVHEVFYTLLAFFIVNIRTIVKSRTVSLM